MHNPMTNQLYQTKNKKTKTTRKSSDAITIRNEKTVGDNPKPALSTSTITDDFAFPPPSPTSPSLDHVRTSVDNGEARSALEGAIGVGVILFHHRHVLAPHARPPPPPPHRPPHLLSSPLPLLLTRWRRHLLPLRTRSQLRQAFPRQEVGWQRGAVDGSFVVGASGIHQPQFSGMTKSSYHVCISISVCYQLHMNSFVVKLDKSIACPKDNLF